MVAVQPRMRLPVPLLLLTLAACESTTEPGTDGPLGRLLADDPAGATVVREYFSGLTEPTSLIITSEQQWGRVWAAIYANRTPVPARPAVDFSTEALVLHALGNSNGVSVEIEGVRLYERGVLARVVRRRYSERCLVLTAVGQPVHVVRIARPAGRIVRTETREEVIPCA